MNYRFTEELSEEQPKAEVAAMMERGNHQSVQEDSEEVAKLLAKDVLQGFSLPVLSKLVPDLAHAMVQTAGVVKQFSLQGDGSSRTLKRRLTQDLSFSLTFPTASVNKWIDISAVSITRHPLYRRSPASTSPAEDLHNEIRLFGCV